MSKRRVFENEHDVEAEGLPSASGFDSEFRCLGKRALCSQLPKEVDTAVTTRGTKIHSALEHSDLSNLSVTDDKTASRIMYGEAKLVHEFDFEGAEVEFEQRLWDVDENLNHTWSAKIDSRHYQPRISGKVKDYVAGRPRLLIADYKSGWTLPPPIENNWQMRSQAALAADQYDAEEVVTALIHPHHAESLYEVRVYTRDDLQDILATVRHNVKAIQMPEQPRTYGGIQCQWCTAKGICPEYRAAQAAIGQSIADEIEDEGYTTILRRSPLERGRHVRGIKEMIKNCQAMLERYVEMAKRDGEAVHGYALKRKMTRAFTDENEAMALVRDKYGADLLYDALHLSLPDLEEALGKKLSSKVEAKAALQRLLNPVLKFKESKSYLEEARSL